MQIRTLILVVSAASVLAQSNNVQSPQVPSPAVRSTTQTLQVLTNPVLTNPVLTNPVLTNPVLTNPVLTNPAIVALAAAGFSEDFLIELIRNSRTDFDTSANGLASLAKQGINERIIRVMVSVSTGAADSSAPAAQTAPAPAAAPAPPSKASTSWLRGVLKKIGIRASARDSTLAARLGAGAV
jgi:hypothetical protein